MLEQRHWGKSGLEPPPDTPACGFFSELCNQQGMYLTYEIVSGNSSEILQERHDRVIHNRLMFFSY